MYYIINALYYIYNIMLIYCVINALAALHTILIIILGYNYGVLYKYTSIYDALNIL